MESVWNSIIETDPYSWRIEILVYSRSLFLKRIGDAEERNYTGQQEASRVAEGKRIRLNEKLGPEWSVINKGMKLKKLMRELNTNIFTGWIKERFIIQVAGKGILTSWKGLKCSQYEDTNKKASLTFKVQWNHLQWLVLAQYLQDNLQNIKLVNHHSIKKSIQTLEKQENRHDKKKLGWEQWRS